MADLPTITSPTREAIFHGYEEDASEGATQDFLRGLDTRVHTVWAARPGLRDLSVAKIMADERTNSVLIVAGAKRMAGIKDLIAALDVK